MTKLVDPFRINADLSDMEKREISPVALGTPCPSCNQTMVKAYSSNNNIMYCEKDGVAIPEQHFDPKTNKVTMGPL